MIASSSEAGGAHRVTGAVRRALLLALLLAAGCASHPVAPSGSREPTFELPDDSVPVVPRSYAEIDAAVQGFQPIIGRWPPHFIDDAHRDAIYREWAEVVRSAEALDPHVDEERRLYLLAELYRQGHNFDVVGAGRKADQTLRECLSRFPKSRPCNLSASYFLLSLQPTKAYLARAQQSLEVLRSLAAPELDEDAEAGFVFLYFHQGDRDRARVQLEKFLADFPDSPRAADFREILENLDRVRVIEK